MKGDLLVPGERSEFLRAELGDAFVAVELDDASGNAKAAMPPHSLVTEHLIDEPGQPTRAALDQVLELFRSRLLTVRLLAAHVAPVSAARWVDMSSTGPPTSRRAGRQDHTDEDIAGVLRAAAAESGDPLSVARYDAGAYEPSSSRIIQRFGSWSAACAAAGLRARGASRRYVSSWDADEVAAAVSRYLSSPGASGSYAGYERWAKTADGEPSAQTVRNMLGGWTQAKAAAVSRSSTSG